MASRISVTMCFDQRFHPKYSSEWLYDCYNTILDIWPLSVQWCGVTLPSVFYSSVMAPYQSSHFLIVVFCCSIWIVFVNECDHSFWSYISSEVICWEIILYFLILVLLGDHVSFGYMLQLYYVIYFLSLLNLIIVFLYHCFMKHYKHLTSGAFRTESIIPNFGVINFSVVWFHLVHSFIRVPTWWWYESPRGLIGA